MANGKLNLDYFVSMGTDIGFWQHANGSEPDRRHGYSIDDVARALIVALGYRARDTRTDDCDRIARVCFRFIERAAIRDGVAAGRFHNFCDDHGRWRDSIGSSDSLGRTIWALGVAHAAWSNGGAEDGEAARAEDLLRPAMDHCDFMTFPRSAAFSLLGLAASRLDDALACRIGDQMVARYHRHDDGSWRWFEDGLTYCNARLPHGLFALARIAPDGAEYLQVAVDSLDFLLSVMRNEKGSYSPIGNSHLTARPWFQRGEPYPPLFDQQPVDAGALVECCAAAYLATGEPRFRTAAHDAFAWYFGRNVHGLSVYDPVTGGVADALTPEGLNRNFGGESVLSIHLAQLALYDISD